MIAMFRGIKTELHHCLEGKMLILKDMDFTIDEKKKVKEKYS